MNKFKSYIAGALAVIAAGVTFTACQDHFDAPHPEAPEATMKPNTTIAEVKEWLWEDGNNYCNLVYTRDYYEALAAGNTEVSPTQGEHIIIAGRVISSDYAGNCFRYITIQDETGALNFSIFSYNLYLNYRRGQEIVVDLTGLYMGKYAGLLEVGFPEAYAGAYQTSFMAPEIFTPHCQLNGMPQIEKLDTFTIEPTELGTSPSDKRKWQSQLIRLNNVIIEKTEGTTLSSYHNNVSQNILTADGTQTGIVVYTSGYSTFWNMPIPDGPVDIVALASCYETNTAYTWQLTLIDASGIITDPTLPPGSEENPYTIGEAIEQIMNPDKVVNAWVKGYIIGTVGPEVEEVTKDSDIEWTAEPVLGETMVIGPSLDCTEAARCLVIPLPQGTSIYDQSLLANPDNYGKEIAVRGTFEMVMGTFGVTTTGASADYIIEGQGGSEDNVSVTEEFKTGIGFPDASKNAPSSPTKYTSSVTGIEYEIMGCYIGSYTGRPDYLMVNGKNYSGAYISFSLDYDCSQLLLHVSSGASANAKSTVNVYANGNLLGNYPANVLSTDIVVSVPAQYQTAGTVYKVESGTNEYNQQFESFTYVAVGHENDNPGSGGDNPGTDDGHGTKDNPLTVAQALSQINGGYTGTLIVKGNIVSVDYYNSNYGSLTYYIADAGSSDKLQVYGGLGLDGAKFSGKEDLAVGGTVIVEGNGKMYNGAPEIDLNSVMLSYDASGSTGGSGDSGNTDGEHGTATAPLTVAQALSQINGGYTGTIVVKGNIVSVDYYNTNYGSLSYYIADAGSSDKLQVYGGLGLNGTKFSGKEDLAVGGTVVVEGKGKMYNGAPEIDTNSVLLSYDANGNTGGSGDSGNTGGDTPSTPTPTPDGATAVFDFTQPATLSPAMPATGSQKDGNNTCENVTGVTFTNNGATVTTTKGTADAREYYQSGGAIQYRVYNGATMTITAPKAILAVDFTFNNSSSKLSCNDVDYSQASNVFTATEAQNLTSIDFKVTANSQINKITVTFAE